MKSSEIRLGTYRFTPETRALIDASGNPVELRYQATEVLLELAVRPNEVVDRGTIIERVWENREGAEDGLAQCIADIRRALNDDEKSIIETIPRKGYRLVSAPPRRAVPVRRSTISGAVALLALFALAAIGFIRTGGAKDEPARPVVAVMPFENADGGGEGGAIGEALGDSIITTLARYSEFDVIARQSSFRIGNDDRDLREVGDILGADYLVQGSQHVMDDRIKVAIQLVDAGDGTLRFVDAFEIPLADALAANDDIAHRIANTVGGSIMDATARTPRRAGEIDALILDNRARLLFQSGPSREKWLAALDLEAAAIAAFPDVEWGYVGKALMLRTGVRFGWEKNGQGSVLAEAEAAARKAIELNPRNYMTHFALGRVLMQKGDVGGSIAALEQSKRLNPSSAIVLNALGQNYIYADDLDALRVTVQRVARIDPLPGVLTLWVRAWAQWQMGECEAARETIETTPSAPLEMAKLRAVIHVCVGDTDAAVQVMADYLDKRPDWTLAREIEANAANWTADGPRVRWLEALAAAGLKEQSRPSHIAE